MAEEHIIQDHELVFNMSGGKIQSAGFTVESILLQKGEPALHTRNFGSQIGGGRVADLFKDLAVPAGLVSFTRKQFGGNIQQSKIQNDDAVISDDIHEKLLKMVEVEGGAKKPRKTRRAIVKSTGKTKKQKITA
jgi:hypothetical protein